MADNCSGQRDPHRYDDMLDMPHPQSVRHPQMNPLARAAQFSPFAALSGFEDQVQETARLTDRKIELSESEKDALNEKLRILNAHLADSPRPTVRITFFRPDCRKEGGSYETLSGRIRRVDLIQRLLLLCDENGQPSSIPLDDVFDIESALFRGEEA